MSEGESSDENSDTSQNAVEKIERADGAYTYEVEERAFDAEVSERPMQTFEHSICSASLLRMFLHEPLVNGK
jgi:hypothetical protein